MIFFMDIDQYLTVFSSIYNCIKLDINKPETCCCCCCFYQVEL